MQKVYWGGNQETIRAEETRNEQEAVEGQDLDSPMVSSGMTLPKLSQCEAKGPGPYTAPCSCH